MADEAVFKFIYEESGAARPAGASGAAASPPSAAGGGPGAPPVVIPGGRPDGGGGGGGGGGDDDAGGGRFAGIRAAYTAGKATAAAFDTEAGAAALRVTALGESAASAGSAIGALGPAALAAGAALLGVVAAVKLFEAGIALANSKISELSQFSGALAAAQAENRALDIEARLQRAAELGPALADFAKAQGELKREFAQATDQLLEAFLPLLTGGVEILTDLLKLINAIPEGFASLKLLLVEAVNKIPGVDLDEKEKALRAAAGGDLDADAAFFLLNQFGRLGFQGGAVGGNAGFLPGGGPQW